MKLTPGVDFTSILQASFASADSKSAKNRQVISAFLHFLNLGTQKSKSRPGRKISGQIDSNNLIHSKTTFF
jgi:hypothetical protein